MKNSYSTRANKEMFSFLGRHLALGLLTGWSLLGIFIGFDFGGLRSLTEQNHLEFLVYPLLAVFFAITFGSTAMGIGIMSMKKTDRTDGGKFIPIEPRATQKFAMVKAVSRK